MFLKLLVSNVIDPVGLPLLFLRAFSPLLLSFALQTTLLPLYSAGLQLLLWVRDDPIAGTFACFVLALPRSTELFSLEMGRVVPP